jgi:hypothetical protein
MRLEILGSGSDPRVIFGERRDIWTDERSVQRSYVVSVAQRGYPPRELHVPGNARE